MKIICTKHEKRETMLAIINGDYCPLIRKYDSCEKADGDIACECCLNEKIEWQIEDGEQ